MKFLSEFIIDKEFEAILEKDLRTLFCCFDIASNSFNNEILTEALSQIANLREVLNILDKKLKEIDSTFKDGDKLFINISEAKSVFDNISITLHKRNKISAAYLKFDNSTVFIELNLENDYYDIYDIAIQGLILHEILHGYEDKVRIENGKPSIFDELSEKYKAGFKSINSKDDIIKNLGIMNYFFDPHERKAYMSTMTLDIENIIKKIKPSYEDLRTNKILKELKQTTIWKNYFDFGKFVLNIDSIDDETLEKSYWEASIETSNKIKAKIERKKTGKEIQYPKKASEIRKECKKKWNSFRKKFDSTFLKIYCETLPIAITEKFW